MQWLNSAYGVAIPRIIYGTAWKKERTQPLVISAFQQGFRGIDTACQPKHYFEPGVGDALKQCLGATTTRAELYLQTKFTPLSGHDPQHIPYDPHARLADQVAQSFRVSQQNLRTEYIDCLVLHSPLHDRASLREAWSAMEQIYDGGGTKQLGLSNCYQLNQLRELYEWARIKPAVLQNRFYAETGYDRDIRNFCRAQHVIYQSFWTLSANPHLLQSTLVQHLANHYRRTPAQILFRYLTQRDIVPLTGTQSIAHMQEALSIFEFELTRPECERLEQLL